MSSVQSPSISHRFVCSIIVLAVFTIQISCAVTTDRSADTNRSIVTGPLYRRQANSYGQSSPESVTLTTINSQLSTLITLGYQTQQKIDALDQRFNQLQQNVNDHHEELRNQVRELQHKISSIEWSTAKVESNIDDLGDRLRTSPVQSSANAPEDKLNSLLAIVSSTRSAVHQNHNELLRLTTNITHLLASTNSVRIQLRAVPTKQFINSAIEAIKTESTPPVAQNQFPMLPAPFTPSRFVKEDSDAPLGCDYVSRNESGIYRVRSSVVSSNTFYAYCDASVATTGSKWMVILNRADGETNFYRNWAEYKNGFGNVNADFWIGLDKLNEITSSRLHELLITLEDFEGEVRTASYSEFAIAGEKEDYALHVLGKYNGNAGDSLTYHAGQKFSTFDEDNDLWTEGNCAQSHTGGWWYNACDMTNLGGKYLNGQVPAHARNQGVYWNDFHGPEYSLKRVRMMIRPVA